MARNLSFVMEPDQFTKITNTGGNIQQQNMALDPYISFEQLLQDPAMFEQYLRSLQQNSQQPTDMPQAPQQPIVAQSAPQPQLAQPSQTTGDPQRVSLMMEPNQQAFINQQGMDRPQITNEAYAPRPAGAPTNFAQAMRAVQDEQPQAQGFRAANPVANPNNVNLVMEPGQHAFVNQQGTQAPQVSSQAYSPNNPSNFVQGQQQMAQPAAQRPMAQPAQTRGDLQRVSLMMEPNQQTFINQQGMDSPQITNEAYAPRPAGAPTNFAQAMRAVQDEQPQAQGFRASNPVTNPNNVNLVMEPGQHAFVNQQGTQAPQVSSQAYSPNNPSNFVQGQQQMAQPAAQRLMAQPAPQTQLMAQPVQSNMARSPGLPASAPQPSPLPDRISRLDTLTPQQNQLLSEVLIPQIMRELGTDMSFEPIRERALRDYERSFIPGVLNQVTTQTGGMSDMGSSSYRNALNAGMQRFAENLTSQEAEYNLRRRGLANQLAPLGLHSAFGYFEEQPPADSPWDKLLPVIGQMAGYAAGGGMSTLGDLAAKGVSKGIQKLVEKLSTRKSKKEVGGVYGG